MMSISEKEITSSAEGDEEMPTGTSACVLETSVPYNYTNNSRLVKQFQAKSNLKRKDNHLIKLPFEWFYKVLTTGGYQDFYQKQKLASAI